LPLKTDQDAGAQPPPRPAAATPPAPPAVIGPPLIARPLVGRPVRTTFPAPTTKRFRLPGRNDPAPDERRLAAVCAWAGALGIGGSFLALRLLVNLFLADGGWYRPTITLIGAVGVAATAGAFASIHRPRLPWVMLSLGSAALAAGYLATAAA
jgi:hypothetical protein